MGIRDDDRAYYLSRIREATDGYPLMGNSALKEHRTDISPNGFVELLTAGIMRVTGWSLQGTVTFTNVLFPFLIVLLTFGWLRGILRSDLLAVTALAAIWLSVWGPSGLLRESSPKATLLLPSLYLCVLLLPGKQRTVHRIVRGALIGLMMYSYHYHWTLLAAFEGLTVLRALLQRREPVRQIIRDAAAVWIPLCLVAIPYLMRLIGTMGDPTAVEMWRRFGMIPTRMIAAPQLQATLLLWLAALGALRFTGLLRTRATDVLPLLIVASLIAVNTNLLTGSEAEFEGHYGRFVRPFMIATLFLAGSAVIRPRTLRWTCLLLLLLGGMTGVAATMSDTARSGENERLWQERNAEQVLAWVDEKTPSGSVVLAPYRLSSLIPVFTDDYVWMNYAARSFFVPEQELLERYIVQIAAFSEDREPIDTGVMSVFGNFPGSLYSKTKRVFQLKTLFQKPFTQTIPDFIVRQDRRQYLEAALKQPVASDVERFLSSYACDFILSDRPLPPPVSAHATRLESRNGFTLYTCGGSGRTMR
jgi:hypothetical protein